MASLLSLISLPLEIQHLPQGLSPRPPCPHISLVHPADVIFLPNKHGLCLCLPDSTSDFLTCSVVSYAHGSCPRWSARSPRLPTPFGIFHLPFAFPSHLLIYWVPPPARMCPPLRAGTVVFYSLTSPQVLEKSLPWTPAFSVCPGNEWHPRLGGWGIQTYKLTACFYKQMNWTQPCPFIVCCPWLHLLSEGRVEWLQERPAEPKMFTVWCFAETGHWFLS